MNVQLSSVATMPVAASTGQRFGAYSIDLVPAIIMVVLVGWVPIIGAMVAGFFLGLYWLLRDVTGASLGKLAVGLRVGTASGGQAHVASRILRNLTIAFGPALLMIPFIGYGLAPVVAAILIIAEMVLLASGGKRAGDRIANTGVFLAR